MKRTSLLATGTFLVALLPVAMHAATRAYFVEPKTATSAWCPYGGNVGQSFIANVDSIYYAEWFVGEPSAPGLYRFEIRDEATSDLVCYGEESVPARGWQWVRCDNWTQGNRCFTKGRNYVVKVSHSDGDSVNFVYRTDNPYQYGVISVGGGQLQPPPQTSHDLVCRIMGRMNAVSDVWRACVGKRGKRGTLPYFIDTLRASAMLGTCQG